MFQDPMPKKIGLSDWSEQFKLVSEEQIKKFTYYHNSEWGIYLSPPATFMVYGTRELKRLKLDNSFAALRLWGFVFNESERLFRAKQIGKKVIATMGDLGIVPVIIMAFPDCVPFYPECIWWTPFFKESTVLLDTATQLGIPEATCFSKATLGAFYKRAYFPRPDAIFASTGASCDDYSCIMQLVEDLGYEIVWLEIPLRKGQKAYPNNASGRLEEYLIGEYQRVWKKMVELTGISDKNQLIKSIKKANQLRNLVTSIKNLTYEAPKAPLPGLELMTIEFGNLYGYADIEEWIDILKMIKRTIEDRIEKGLGVLQEDAIPIAWITPSADPLLLNLVEDAGLRIVQTEYVINQALVPIEEDIEPFRALARAFLQASLIGKTSERVKRIIAGVKEGKIKGVLITNMLGASHCAMETGLIMRFLSAVPVLAIDVPQPFGITEQLKTRILAFAETLKH
jgi:benzoyl-CoA reductase/2-hydroxyglutaryl-CoA dehydratase subunit BcrC/BadD/HgdB